MGLNLTYPVSLGCIPFSLYKLEKVGDEWVKIPISEWELVEEDEQDDLDDDGELLGENEGDGEERGSGNQTNVKK
jgi:hypothetical protein